MNLKAHSIWIKRILAFTLSLVFAMGFHGISSADPANAESSEASKEISKLKVGMLKELSTYLKLEPNVMHDKLQSQSLAEIAQQQGFTRAELKSKIMELMKARASSRPSPLGTPMDFSAAADKLMDKKGGWHQGGKRHPRRLINVEELAKVLKMTPEQLKKSLQSGKSLATLAEENGVSVQSVIDQQVKAVMDRLDRHLAEGTITKDKYEERKANVKQFVTDFVNGRYMKPQEDHFRHRSISQNSLEE